MIKGNYLNLDDALVVSEIASVGSEGAKFFCITLKNGKAIEFFYHSSRQEDAKTSNGNFSFGTSAFFFNAHEEIIKILTDASQFPPTR
jgi:hypothetical protein